VLSGAGHPDSILLIGGTSQIAIATAVTLSSGGPLHVVLAARATAGRTAAATTLRAAGATVDVVDFDAADLDRSLTALAEIFDHRVVDVAVVAQGQLPDQNQLEADPAAVVEVCLVNYTSAVAVGLLLARRMERQGHGVIAALSSVAAVRPRRENYVYGSTKAGLDAFYTGLRERLVGSGVRVLVLRPGFVHSRMTAGLAPAPFAVHPEAVARAIASALATGNRAVWVPRVLGPVMGAVRLLPQPIFRRLRA